MESNRVDDLSASLKINLPNRYLASSIFLCVTLNAPILTAELQRVVCEQRLNDVVASLKFLFPGGGRFAATDSVAREHHVLGSQSELKLGRPFL